ncbi:hypothetical protein ACHAW5_006548 [Stephanodiscus triporus]|uniref:Calcineurin-like phosphoesterase domain-containing protein n=1 Tax=Stephanodiscus triporus TaxID=2934178 RepID=A0ABD3MGN0_9STRA
MNARNSSDSDDGVGAAGTTPRVSAKMRFLATPPSMPSPSSYDYGNNDNHRVVVRKQPSLSKGGINGSSVVVDDDGDAGGGNGRGHASLVRGAIGRQQQLQQQQASHRSSRSDVAATASVDRPWRTSSSAATASYASTARSADYYYDGSEEDAVEFSVGGVGALSTSSRWSQYETDDLEEESRRATSNAVVDVATRLANSMGGSAASASASAGGEEEDVGFLPSSGRAEEEGRRTTAIMGGVAGTGYGYGYGGGGAGDISSSEMSTTDYVKSRLSSLLMNNKARDSDYNTPSSYGAQSDHDKVRNEALKMLHLADTCLQDSPHSPRSGNYNNNNNNNGATTALFRTTGGGLAMREMSQDEVEAVKRRGIASIAGLDRFGSGSGYDRKGAFTIGSHDEDDNDVVASSSSSSSSVTGGRRGGGSGGDDSNDPNEDTPSLWSSRYSVERQLMAITGGLDSAHMLAKMDMLHSSREKTKSARGMYRSSGHAVDGSHVEYGDYTKSSSSPGMAGFGMDRLWLYVRGTLWSDDPELNYDGTTQSLVRREKAMRRRRRVRWGLLFLAALCVAVGALVRAGNPKSSGNVNFYVLSDEPYKFSNIAQLTRDLQAVPDDADFVVHLGNVNSDAQTMCREYGFERAAAVLGESPVPVLIVPGDLDWAACGSEESSAKSLGWWKAYLGRLEDRWDHGLEVEHDDAVIGNFAFLRKGVLFVGISMIDGLTSPGEVTSRLERNVLWTKDKLVRYDAGGKKKDGGGYHAVVIFGHAPPSDIQGEYFWPMLEQFKKIDRPVLYLHANKSGSFERYTPYDEAENFSAVQLEKRGLEAPMKVVVMGQDGKRRDKGNDVDLFVFERRESNLERQEE